MPILVFKFTTLDPFISEKDILKSQYLNFP